MLGGDGGLGKTLLAQQLITCIAIGKPWLGFATTSCPTVAVFCEDELEELHIRQAAINDHYGCKLSDLKDCAWIPRVGEDNVLMHFPGRGPGQLSPFYTEICQVVEDMAARLVVLDSQHDLFGGDEIRRSEVRQFVGALRLIVRRVNGAVLLLSHPSISGMNSGSGSSGSTAWNNAVRSRLYLTRPTSSKQNEKSQEEDGDPNERVLKTMKSNYGPVGGKIPLLWQNGVFVRQDERSASSIVDKLEIDRLALEALRELVGRDTKVPLNPHAPTAFANVGRQLPSCKHLSQSLLDGALNRLLASGKVVKVDMGPPSRRHVYVRPADMRYPGEVKDA
jgi:RecA-family ATPase